MQICAVVCIEHPEIIIINEVGMRWGMRRGEEREDEKGQNLYRESLLGLGEFLPFLVYHLQNFEHFYKFYRQLKC
jgi:hypothetical protein